MLDLIRQKDYNAFRLVIIDKEMKIKVVCKKNNVSKNGTAPLYLRFTHNRETRLVSLGISVLPEYWNEESQSIFADYPNSRELQFEIDARLKEYDQKMKRLQALEVEVNFETLLGYRSVNQYYVTDYFDIQIRRLEVADKYGSASKYKVTRALLNEFRPSAKFGDIDTSFLQDFGLFLHKRGNQSNSIATKMSVLKAVYNKALKEKVFVSTNNPFADFKVGRYWKPTRKRAIVKQDVLKLQALEIPNEKAVYSISFARDIFLFSYFVAGINFKDIATLQCKDIQNGRIYYKRHKTGKEMNSPILPDTQQIIDKYAENHMCEDDYIFPILDRKIHVNELQIYNRVHKVLGHVNRNLKKLGKMIGLRITLTTYVARHTYATVLRRAGVSIDIISETLGHSDTTTTQIYLDSFENFQIDKAMENLK